MAGGFFKKSTLLTQAPKASLLPQCGACGLQKKCQSPKLTWRGQGKKRILIVGGPASSSDDEAGQVFTDFHSVSFKKELRDLGIELFRDCWCISSVACSPGKQSLKNEVVYCRPNVVKAIKELKPTMILLLGFHAVKSVISAAWKEEAGVLDKWLGTTIPGQQWNSWICATYGLKEVYPRDLKELRRNPVPRLLFKQHVQIALDLAKKRPWKTVPDYRKDVEIIYSPAEAAKIIKSYKNKKCEIALDYETNMLKPEGPTARIYSCSLCFGGEHTIAYPWVGEAVGATRKILRAPHPKIAANLKFETRWTKYHLKTNVRNWVWDTMIAAHALNSTPGTKSVKFQAFILLGQPCYNAHIEPLLQSDGSSCYDENKIQEIDLADLLLYNGMDSILEYALAEIQRTAFK